LATEIDLSRKDELRAEILRSVRAYYEEAFTSKAFIPGESSLAYSGRVFDHEELEALVDSSLDFWLTSGRFAEAFEHEFARFLRTRHAMLCNSGSSANLLALSALTSPKLGAERLLPGDEVITVAAGFPTTVNPIVQNRLVPVFVDIDPKTYNIDVTQLEAALSARTRAIMVAHTLGNPFDVDAVLGFAERHDLWVVEDNCDALGSTWRGKLTGTFGDLGTESFYPAHHITMGEGGCVMTDSPRLKVLVESFRDWGRDCWCEPGRDNTCGKRFAWQLGGLPYGYDHKNIYSHIGYNLKITDMQAAIGLAQLRKLPSFIEARKRNWQQLLHWLRPLQEFLQLPVATEGSDPSWFGFVVTVRDSSPFTSQDLNSHLQAAKVATRSLFAGNMTLQPAYKQVEYRTVGDLRHTNEVMRRSFWIGVYPGLSEEMLAYTADTISGFVTNAKKASAVG
jgi:CDP-4-dehydro-6-deoxyglucose reductase, E1